MKLLILFLLLFGLNSSAQSKYFVEYNSSIYLALQDIRPFNDLIIDNNISFGIKKNKMLFSLGIGREDWYLEYFHNKDYINPSIYNAHCRTYKISSLLEHQFFIIKSKFSINLGIGCKIYFLNQIKDSLSSNLYGRLSISKPSYLLAFKLKNPNYYDFFDEYGVPRLITSVPFAFTTNIAFQYTFKNWAIKFYYQPYFMRVKYKTIKSFYEGSNFAFYSNLGLGINYPLNFKKKDKQNSGLQ